MGNYMFQIAALICLIAAFCPQVSAWKFSETPALQRSRSLIALEYFSVITRISLKGSGHALVLCLLSLTFVLVLPLQNMTCVGIEPLKMFTTWSGH